MDKILMRFLLVVLLASSQAFGALSVTQIVNTQSKTAATTTALTFASTGATALIVAVLVMDPGTTGTAVTCTDSASGTYIQHVDQFGTFSGTSGSRLVIFSRSGAASGITSVTFTHGSVAARAAVGYEIAGAATTAAVDKSVSTTSTTATTLDSGLTATTAQANEILIGAWGYEQTAGDITSSTVLNDGVGSGTTYTAPSLGTSGAAGGCQNSTTGGAGGTNQTLVAAYEIVSTANAYKASMALGVSYSACSAIVTFKSAVAGSSRPPHGLITLGVG